MYGYNTYVSHRYNTYIVYGIDIISGGNTWDSGSVCGKHNNINIGENTSISFNTESWREDERGCADTTRDNGRERY